MNLSPTEQKVYLNLNNWVKEPKKDDNSITNMILAFELGAFSYLLGFKVESNPFGVQNMNLLKHWYLGFCASKNAW